MRDTIMDLEISQRELKPDALLVLHNDDPPIPIQKRAKWTINEDGSI